jgi:predicted nucleic acid-binding protein
VIVVDTSVWVSAHQSEDVHFSESLSWYEFWTVRELELHFPLLVVPEIAGVLSRKGIPPADVAKSIGDLVGSRTSLLHELDLTNSLLAARVSASTGLKGADAVFVALAAWLDLPLVTWDRQQRERGSVFCRTMTPVEAREVHG